MTNANTVPVVGNVVEATFGEEKFRYLVCKIDGEGYALVPMSGLFAGRIFKGNRYESLEELLRQLNDNKAMFVVEGSTWEIVSGNGDSAE